MGGRTARRMSDVRPIRLNAAHASAELQLLTHRYTRFDREGDLNHPDLGKYSSMAKVLASDAAMAVTVEAVQVFGGCGDLSDYRVERMMRDAKITQIYEGTNEIQWVVIAWYL